MAGHGGSEELQRVNPLMTKRVPLTDMKIGETGVVAEILGGKGGRARLKALGVREGIKVRKVSTHLARGPVVIQLGGTQTALGHGISNKVVVEVNR